VTTLAALISGIVGSQSTQLPKMAAHVPDGTQSESRVKRFARWLRNDRITAEVYFIPFAKVLLTHLALQTLVLVMDGSVVGRGGVTLMLHVVYKGRALPVAWLVRHGKKGHSSENLSQSDQPVWGSSRISTCSPKLSSRRTWWRMTCTF
jgi:hypothetical protein